MRRDDVRFSYFIMENSERISSIPEGEELFDDELRGVVTNVGNVDYIVDVSMEQLCEALEVKIINVLVDPVSPVVEGTPVLMIADDRFK